jgi:transcriptional regulator with XRE-family HTH domain
MDSVTFGSIQSTTMSKNNVLATFAKRIEELRNLKGWSQAELAKKLGTSAPVVGRYERAVTAPSIEVSRKIANVLEVTLDYMTDPEAELDAVKDQEMLDRLNKIVALPTEDKTRIVEVVDALIRDANARAAYGTGKRKSSA